MDEPRTAAGRDLLAHSVQYDPADADKAVTGAKIAEVEREAAALGVAPGVDLGALEEAIAAVDAVKETGIIPEDAEAIGREYLKRAVLPVVRG